MVTEPQVASLGRLGRLGTDTARATAVAHTATTCHSAVLAVSVSRNDNALCLRLAAQVGL